LSAVVTFSRNRIAYTVSKSLSKKGIKVINCDSVYPAMTYFSKYSHSFFVHPVYTEDPSGFVRNILVKLQKLKPDVLIPCHEEAVLIAYFKRMFEKHTIVPIASYEKIEMARDKTKMTELAQSLGIPIPKTYQVKNVGNLSQISEEIEFPIVIKIPRGRGAWGVSYVRNKEELIRDYKNILQKFGHKSGVPFLQEYIPGDGYGVSMLFNSGELRAKFTHKRLLEYPITGGASVERISVKKPKMEEYAQKILSHLQWHGVAMIEFKLDRRSGKPTFLEINPRFWGSLHQAVRAGVDFPALLYEMAVTGDVKPVFNYNVGIRTVWVFGQIQTILDSIRKGRTTEVFKKLKPFHRDTYYDDFSLTDLTPFFVEPIPYLIEFFRKGSLDAYTPIDEPLESVKQLKFRNLN